jgi:hypothetical protein
MQLAMSSWAYLIFGWVRGSVVGWGAMLQTGRSWFRFPMRLLDFSIDLIFPAALWPWGRLSLWQKWVPGIFLGVKGGRRVRLIPLPPYVSRLSIKYWGPWRLTSLWASTACYRNSFTFFKFYVNLLFIYNPNNTLISYGSQKMSLVFPVVSFRLAFPPISSMHSSYMSYLSHPPWLDHSNYTWRRVEVMKLLIM